MGDDPSAGWDAAAGRFAALRSGVGTDVVERWAAHLPPGGAVVDIGCGTGRPVAGTLIARGFALYGIDPSPTLLAMFRRDFPAARWACEAAEISGFFDRRFDGAVAIGLLFLLPEDGQRAVIERAARSLHPGGHFLFSTPRHPCRWVDSLTGRPSISLGEARYRRLLADAGCRLVGFDRDKGSNDYFHAVAAAV